MEAGASKTTWSAAALGSFALVLLAGCSSEPSGHVSAGSARAHAAGDGAARPDRTSRADGTTEPTSTAAEGDGNGTATGPSGSDAAAVPEAADASEAAAVPGPTSDVTAQDRRAGVLSHDVPDVGDGVLHRVPGASPAPGDGTVRRMRVSVEGGLPVDGQAFASFVLDTLNDGRSWTRDGYTFARTDGTFDTHVVVASPVTSREMCRPLETMGTLSCRNGDKVVLTWYRWVNGQEDFGEDLTGYRHYLVNHEVGHSLGHGHASCPGPGRLAPVMMQQTKGVKPCLPNAWPYP